MSKNFVEQTLTFPKQLPLFNYNINFDGLRKLLENVNIQTNDHSQQIHSIQKTLQKKLFTLKNEQMVAMLDNSLSLGVHCEDQVQKNKSSVEKMSDKNPKNKNALESLCYKITKMGQIIEQLVIKSQQQQNKINNDDKRHENNIKESIRRLDDKIDGSLQSFNKTINGYFDDENKKVSTLISEVNCFKLNTESKFSDFEGDLKKKTSQAMLKSILEGNQETIKKQLQTQLHKDQMKRMANLNQYGGKLKQAQKDIEMQSKRLQQKIFDLSEKVNKSLALKSFQVEKHKIYEKFSQFRTKIEDLFHRNDDLFTFRKQTMGNSQKSRQQLISLQQQIKKLQDKNKNSSKIENIQEILLSLDPHLICQISSQLKLHQKEIGKLQKITLQLNNRIQDKKQHQTMPEVNSGQNSDMIQKIIKQYMSNMDFQGRIKKTEKDIHQLGKKNQTVHDLEKKVYLLGKEMDMPGIMKELKKKCDEDNTRRDHKVLDSKIEQLFEFYKQIRREIEEVNRKNGKQKESFDKYALTTKKLYTPNCLSCTTQTNKRQQSFWKKIDYSYDESVEHLKNTVYSRSGLRK